MELLDEKRAREQIKRGLASSSDAQLAVAFWGDGAIEELGIDTRIGPLAIICNLEAGGTNPAVIAALLKMKVPGGGHLSVQQNDRLHAKVYLFDDFAIVGSSNASTNGLAFEGGELSHWFEANICVRDEAVLASIRTWMGELVGRDINPADLKRARAAWAARRSIMRMPRDISSTVLEALRFEPDSLAKLPLFLTVYHDQLSEEGAKVEGEVRKQLHSTAVGVFENWKNLPDLGLLITFKFASGRYEDDGTWERRGRDEDRVGLKKVRYQVAWEVDRAYGKTPVGEAEHSVWSDICKAAVRDKATKKEPKPDICISLQDVLAKGYLPAAFRPDSFETDVWRSIKLLEQALTRERGKTTRLSRTRPKIDRVGEQQTVFDLIRSKTPSEGFRMLLDRHFPERTFEAVALRHPSLFDQTTLDAAKHRLASAGLNPADYRLNK